MYGFLLYIYLCSLSKVAQGGKWQGKKQRDEDNESSLDWVDDHDEKMGIEMFEATLSKKSLVKMNALLCYRLLFFDYA